MLATLCTALGITRLATVMGLMSDELYRVIAPPAPPAASAPPMPPKPVLTLPITQVSSPNQDDRPAGTVIDALIIHDTETPPGIRKALTVANYFLNPRSEVSAHYIIGKAGEVVQCVPDEKRAWHCGPSRFEGREKVNDFSLGIELVNAQTGTDPFPDAQYASLIKLASDLVSRYNIPLTHVTGHRNITNFPGIKRDPADNFDWERFLTGVQAMTASHQIARIVTPLVPVGVLGGTGM